MKRWTLPLLMAVSTLTSAQETNKETSYSQTAPVSQPKQNASIMGDYPIFIQGDLLYGRIITEQGIAAEVTENNLLDTFYRFPNKNGFGFRAGLGIGLQDKFNLQVLWTWLRNGSATQKVTIGPTGTNTQVFLYGANLYSSNVTPSLQESAQNQAVTVIIKQKLRYQTVDLFTQAASAIFWNFLKVQPLGGLRYFYFKAHYTNTFKIDGQDDRCNFSDAKIHATGFIVGTDLKFIFNCNFYFFSTLLTGILAGHQRGEHHTNFDTEEQVIIPKFRGKFELTMNPFFEGSWGLGYEYLFSNNVILALRASYRLTHIVHEDLSQISLGAQIFPAIVKTQVGVFGATVSF